jgi:hypothetical protein
MVYRLRAVAILVATLVVLGGFHSSAQAQTEPALSMLATPAATDLLKVNITGGFCIPKFCDRELTIQSNGSYQYVQGETVRATGKLSRREVRALKRLIKQADFAAIKSQPFQGVCPIAFDGTKTTYTFLTQNQPEVIDDCEVAVDVEQPLFQQTLAIFQRIEAAAAPTSGQ